MQLRQFVPFDGTLAWLEATWDSCSDTLPIRRPGGTLRSVCSCSHHQCSLLLLCPLDNSSSLLPTVLSVLVLRPNGCPVCMWAGCLLGSVYAAASGTLEQSATQPVSMVIAYVRSYVSQSLAQRNASTCSQTPLSLHLASTLDSLRPTQ